MPYGPTVKSKKGKPLTDEERAQRVKELQAEQEKRLRRALGDDLFEWLQGFEGDMDVLGVELPDYFGLEK